MEKNPIIVIRYKCSQSSNFNLCEKCCKNNNKEITHVHNFFMNIEEEKTLNNNINYNEINKK